MRSTIGLMKEEEEGWEEGDEEEDEEENERRRQGAEEGEDERIGSGRSWEESVTVIMSCSEWERTQCQIKIRYQKAANLTLAPKLTFLIYWIVLMSEKGNRNRSCQNNQMRGSRINFPLPPPNVQAGCNP